MFSQIFDSRISKEIVISFIEKFSVSILNFIASIFLIKLLGFESLGFIGSFSLITGVALTISDGGFTQLILKLNNLNSKDYSGIFIVNFFIGLTLISIIFLFAENFASYYDDQSLTYWLKLYTLTIIFNSLSIVPVAVMTKTGKYKKLLKLNSIAILSSLILFYIYYVQTGNINYRESMYYFILLSFLRSLLLLIFFRFNLSLSKISFKNIIDNLDFNISVILGQIINSVGVNIVAFALPNLIDYQVAGIYALFNKIKEFSVGNINHSVHRVIFSSLSSLKEYNKRNNLMLSSTALASLIALIIMIGIFIFRDLIILLFGSPDNTIEYGFIILYVCFLGSLWPILNLNSIYLQHENHKKYLSVEIIGLLLSLLIFLITEEPVNFVLYMSLSFFICTLISSYLLYMKRSIRIYISLYCISLLLIFLWII
mgnify:CR=1 FL=1|tara:strand:+ start:2888 stop:4171 length:1284 start_codon:yes stop_codon:yes gene_type:complete